MVDMDEVVQYSKGLTLLYVEDNDDAREMTTMILEDFFDTIVVAVDGDDGLKKYKENSIDIIITDINMPKLNGIEMCEKIRQEDDEVPIIVLSAHNEDNFFMDSIDVGVNGYLLKPIDIDKLTNVIFKTIEKYKYIREAKTTLNLLEVYQEATNKNSLVFKTNVQGVITYVNELFCERSGYRREELVGQEHTIIKPHDNSDDVCTEILQKVAQEKKIWKGVVRNCSKNSKSFYVDSVILPIVDADGIVVEYIFMGHDISDIMNPVKQLNKAMLNFYEPLVIYLKLDKFEMMEEFYTQDILEIIQEKAAKHLEKRFSQLYDFDKIYPLGNGDFALLIEYSKYFKDEKSFIAQLKQCQEKISEDKIDLDEMEYDIAVLMSVAYGKEKVFESAKLGMKKLLKIKKDFIIANNLAIMEQEKAKENIKVVSMIKKALSESKIVSYFQPIIDNKTQEIVKYESLVRLIDENDKVISPFFFLETSKKSNHYPKITNVVMEHSFSILRNSEADISINISAIDIEQKMTRERILDLLEANKEHTSRVVFELLEDENVKEFDVIREFIQKVKSYGVKIAIDDFGAGYSNYERLLDYQPDILKIDGCLIKDIASSSYSLSAVKSIVTFAKEQNIQTIAEFIENESIFKIVKELGVDFSQGYYFGKPEPLHR